MERTVKTALSEQPQYNISETLSNLIMARPQTNHPDHQSHHLRNLKNLKKQSTLDSYINLASLGTFIGYNGPFPPKTSYASLKKTVSANENEPIVFPRPAPQSHSSQRKFVFTPGGLGPTSSESRLNTQQSTESDRAKANILKLDFNKLNEYKSLIDQKEKTISDLRTKLKVNESRSIMKSNLMQTDSVLNFRVGEGSADIATLKRVLVQLIGEAKESLGQLNLRCNKVKEIVDLFESRIQFDDLLFLKEKDVNRMNEHLKVLTETLVSVSRTELTLNERVRELMRVKHDFSQVQKKNEVLEKTNSQLSMEMKELKAHIAHLKEEECTSHKRHQQDQNTIHTMSKRLEFLEQGLDAMNTGGSHSESKLKNTINFLIRQNQELKKELQQKKRVIEEKEKETQKALNKLQRLAASRKDGGESEEEEEMKKKIKETEVETHPTIDSSNLEDVMNNLPSIKKYSDADKNLEFRMKTLTGERRGVLKELYDSGHSFFVDYLFRSEGGSQVQDKFKLVAEEFLKAAKFCNKLNHLLTFSVQSFNQPSEEALIETISSQPLLDKAQRLTLWLKDQTNHELWTVFKGRRVCMELGADVAGESMIQRRVVVVPNVKEHFLFGPKNDEYEERFKSVDPYLYAEREFVVAFPLFNPCQIDEQGFELPALGALEVHCCNEKQMPLEDFYLAEVLSHLVAQLSSMIIANNQHTLSKITHHNMIAQGLRVISCVNEYRQLGELSKEQIKLIVFSEFENFCQTLFQTEPHNLRLILYEDETFSCFDQEKNQFKHQTTSLAKETFRQQLPLIFLEPSKECTYNGVVDLDVNSAILCAPLTDSKEKSFHKFLGALEIVQPQIKRKQPKHNQKNYIFISESQKEVFSQLSIILSEIL